MQISCNDITIKSAMTESKPDFKKILEKEGCRATPVRILLLSALWEEKKPVSVDELQKKLGNKPDVVTIYRILELFTKLNIVRLINFQRNAVNYELNILRDHHHHVVCTSCGIVEDVFICDEEKLEIDVLSKSKNFKHIDNHSLEFFGKCTACSSVK